jgi:hypothetical protein
MASFAIVAKSALVFTGPGNTVLRGQSQHDGRTRAGPRTRDRPAEIKAIYDLGSVFHHNVNIKSA